MSRIFLYCRVSTEKQSTDTQEHDLLKRFPEGKVTKETASGNKHRPELERLLASLQDGDTLAVAALDRLGRKLIEILTRLEDLSARGVNVVSLREGVDYKTPTGRLVVGVLMCVAQLERELIGQRTSATLQAMKARGIRVGRPFKYTDEQVERVRELGAAGHSCREVAKITGVSKTVVNRLIMEEVA